MRIRIVNFEKFNPRSDVKSSSWYRMDNLFTQDSELFEIDSDGKIVYVHLLGMASRALGGDFTINESLIGVILNIPTKKIKASIQALLAKGKIEVLSASKSSKSAATIVNNEDTIVSETDPIVNNEGPGPTDEQTDKQTDRQTRASDRKSLVKVWENDDEYAKVFSNLSAIPQYAKVFDREKDRATLKEHAEKYSLLVNDLEQITYELKHWADGRELKSPRGQLATFVRHFAERKTPSKKPLQLTAPMWKGDPA